VGETLGMRPLVAHARLSLGKLERRAGDLPASRAAFAAATTEFRALGMSFWLSHAENVAEHEHPA